VLQNVDRRDLTTTIVKHPAGRSNKELGVHQTPDNSRLLKHRELGHTCPCWCLYSALGPSFKSHAPLTQTQRTSWLRLTSH